VSWLKAKDIEVGEQVTDKTGRKLTKVRQIEGIGLWRSRAIFRDQYGHEIHRDNDAQMRRDR
jgi:hypothetical protein